MEHELVNIGRLADAAKIRLSDAEAAELQRDMGPLFELAESLVDVEIPKITYKDAAITISELRADIPVKATCLDEIFDQAPTGSGGSGGFTIPRLLE